MSRLTVGSIEGVTFDGLDIGNTSTSNSTMTITSANNTSAILDLIGDLSGTKGFRVKYEGNGNYFSILDNTSSVLTERFKIDANGYVTKPNQPAFNIKKDSSETVTSVGGIINFTNALLNTGNHYSTTTGLFTAPVSGVYYFAVKLLTPSDTTGGDIRLAINGTQNNNYAGYGSTYNGHKQTMITNALYLNANDSVGVVSYSASQTFYGQATHGHSSFAGFLIG
jgi:hypothetical protein